MIEVSPEEILAGMRRENPWWAKKSLDRSSVYATTPARFFFPEVMELFISSPVRREIVLLGPRRVGKTFLAQQMIRDLIAKEKIDPQHILYLQVDNPLYVGSALERLLDLFKEATGSDWRKTPCYVFFDEIQYLTDWEVHLKVLHDAQTETRFLVTGSAGAALSQGSRESGAGRFTDFFLPPLTFAEYLHFRGDGGLVEKDEEGYYATDSEALNRAFLRYINFGGYPEIALIDEPRETAIRYMRSDIIDKVLLRDLPSLYGISDVRELNKLFTMLAFNSGHELSMEALSQKSSVAGNTIRRYLEYLEAAFLITPLRRIDESARTFKRDRTFKVYLTNPSLRTGLFSPITATGEHYGHAVETAIFAQRFHRLGEQLHYARWKAGKTFKEIKLVDVDPAMRPKEVVEIKTSDRAAKKKEAWATGIDFCHKNGLKEMTVTTKALQESIVKEGTKIHFEPAALYAYRLGAEQFKI